MPIPANRLVVFVRDRTIHQLPSKVELNNDSIDPFCIILPNPLSLELQEELQTHLHQKEWVWTDGDTLENWTEDEGIETKALHFSSEGLSVCDLNCDDCDDLDAPSCLSRCYLITPITTQQNTSLPTWLQRQVPCPICGSTMIPLFTGMYCERCGK